MPKIILATANTHYGRMARTQDGFSPLAEAHADILTLQEIRDPEADAFTTQLDRSGFRLVHAAGACGLAMAVRTDTQLSLVPGSERKEVLKEVSPLEGRLHNRGSRLVGQFPERGMIAARFLLQDASLTIGTVHPTPPARPYARRMQILGAGTALAEPYYQGNLIVAGDWNHYPAARPADVAMRRHAGLSVADIGSEATWGFRGIRHEWAARAVSMVTRPTLQNLTSWGDVYLDDFDAQLDAVLYRGDTLRCLGAEVVRVESDHRAIVASFSIAEE